MSGLLYNTKSSFVICICSVRDGDGDGIIDEKYALAIGWKVILVVHNLKWEMSLIQNLYYLLPTHSPSR